MAPEVLNELGSEGTRRIHRRAGQRATNKDVGRDCQPDRETGNRLERSAGIRGGREDNPDQEEGQDQLCRDAGARPDRGVQLRGTELARVDGGRREDPLQEEGSDHGTRELRDPVNGPEYRRQPARDEEAEGDRRIEVSAGDVPDRRP